MALSPLSLNLLLPTLIAVIRCVHWQWGIWRRYWREPSHSWLITSRFQTMRGILSRDCSVNPDIKKPTSNDRRSDGAVYYGANFHLFYGLIYSFIFKKVSQGKESDPSWRRQMLKEHVGNGDSNPMAWVTQHRIRYSRLRAAPLSPKSLWSCYFKVKPLHNVVLTAPPFNFQARLMVPQLALRSMSPASATLSAPPYQCGIHPRNTYSHSPTLWVESAVRSEDTTGIG